MLVVGLGYEGSFTQVSLTGRGFMFQDVAAESMATFEFSSTGYFEAFCGASAGFHLRHSKFLLRLFLLGRNDHGHVAAFDFRLLFYNGSVAELFCHLVEQYFAQLRMAHFTAAEHDRDLDLVAVLQKAGCILELNAKVMVFNTGAQLDFFDFKDFLFLAGFFFPFLLLVTIFAIIQYLAYRRTCLRRDFHQVQVVFHGHVDGVTAGHDTQLLSVLVDDADLSRTDIVIDA